MPQLLKPRLLGRKMWTAALLAVLVSSSLIAGVFDRTAHGDPATGLQRLQSRAVGSCRQCHSEGSEDTSFPRGLWRENDNELCYTCHRVEDVSGTYPGQRVYQASPHAIDSRFVRFALGQRHTDDLEAAGKCVNCHDPHGTEDRQGLVPALLVDREARLCISCHDGDPADDDIARDLAKPFAHVTRRGSGSAHAADEGGDPGRYADLGGARHVTCSDCHNAHASYPEATLRTAPQASSLNAWVGRVRVVNGSAGTVPSYEYLGPLIGSDSALEYEICFKCHSSWTRQPAGQADLGRLLNPNNRSYHPVEARGNNLNILPEAFVPGVDASSTVFCSDCHGSDDPTVRGPHGSQYEDLLRRPYEVRGATAFADRADLCFQCHNYDTYASRLGASVAASRFNPPATRAGHAFHVGDQNLSCFSCHESHGSPRHIALMVTGRFPGLIRFTSNREGGTCQSSCHGAKSYTINYRR